MKYIDVFREFKSKQITLFTTKDFAQVSGLSFKSSWANLGRYIKKGLIKSPKRGFYYFADNPPNEYLMANKLYSPSYISFETALAYYSIIPEVVYSITSATTKATRSLDSEGKTFKYLKIKTEAYTGYFKKDDYLIADPEKALVDYLYFVALGRKKKNDRLKLDMLNMDKVKEYAELFKNNWLNKSITKI